MRIVVSADELHVDVHPIAGLLHASLEHIAHAQLFCDLRQIFRRTAIARSRSARDHPKPADPRKRGDDFILNSLREKRVLLIRAEVFERQHRN